MGKPVFFDDLDAEGVENLISRACMSQADKEIARRYFIDREAQMDIAVNEKVCLSRSAVGKRIKCQILPELARVRAIKPP